MEFFSLRHRLLVVRYLLGMTGLLICCVTSQAFAVDVTLSWDDPNNTPADVGGYNLYYGPTGQTLTAVDVGNSKMHTLTGLDAGQSYDFAVTAYDTNHGRESVLSDKVTFTTPTAPPPTSPPPTTPPPASPPPVAGDPFLQDGGSNGLVVMEAEQFHNNTSQGGHSWISITRSGASGSGAMQATPNNGTTQDSNYVTSSPRLDFQVQFVRTGTHYVWLRGLAPSRRDDTVHVGLDGQAVSSSDRITSFSSTWRWSKTTLDRSVATIQVPTTGVHTVNVWMREDGLIVDKLVLTTNSRYTPSGTGPSGTATMAVASSSVWRSSITHRSLIILFQAVYSLLSTDCSIFSSPVHCS
jgi:hypothetical protein